MPIIAAEGKKLYFAHVPKVGGSSVVDYLTRRFGGPLAMNGGAFDNGARQPDMIVSPAHMTARSAAIMLLEDVDHSFTVVRDPLSRMLSQYRFQTGVSRMSRLGFSTWLRIVLAAARRDPRVYDNHIRPQSDIVPQDAVVFRFENRFEDMIAWLDEVTGRPAPEIGMQHLLKRARAPLAVRREDVERIAEFYRVDYERFGYAPPDPAEYPRDGVAPLRGLLGAAAALPLVAWQHRKWLR